MRQRWRSYFGTDIPGYAKRKRNARGKALIGLFGGFFAAYLISEMMLDRFVLPLHWLAAVVTALVLYVVGYLWLLHRSYSRSRLRGEQRS